MFNGWFKGSGGGTQKWQILFICPPKKVKKIYFFFLHRIFRFGAGVGLPFFFWQNLGVFPMGILRPHYFLGGGKGIFVFGIRGLI